MHDSADTLWPRFAAATLDAIVILPFWAAQAVLGISPLSWPGWGLGFAMAFTASTYFVLMHARGGQTLGKRAMDVRVVDHATGGGLTVRQSLLREFPIIAINGVLLGLELILVLIDAEQTAPGIADRYWSLQWLPNLWFIADAVTALCHRSRRSLHDFIGDTVVVHCGRRGR
jgi:uncharacterized RDD family membrane protein YckC